MARIGIFSKIGDDYNGVVQTIILSLSVEIKMLTSSATADYIVLNGLLEIGRGWRRSDRNENSYISLKIDDLAFTSPIYATLVKNELSGEYDLEWSR